MTYGSPITSIFGRFFPEYFGDEAVVGVLRKLSDPAGLLAWRNFYRQTDPIGGRVFETPAGKESPGTIQRDTELDDPMQSRPADLLSVPDEAPLEHDRAVWSQIAVHSYYLNEPELKDWVVRLKAAMGNPTAAGGPGAPSPGDGTVVNIAEG